MDKSQSVLISIAVLNLILLVWLLVRSYGQESDPQVKYRRLRMIY